MKLFTKGNWFYEMQILMAVFMWQHDLTHKNQATHGIKIGHRIFVWYDTAWLTHGFGARLSRWFPVLRKLSKKTIETRKFFKSLRAYLKLYRGGFRISTSETQKDDPMSLEIYRFWWNDRVIREMPDIDHVGGKTWNTVYNGSVKKLD
jgi:hypothetical protein